MNRWKRQGWLFAALVWLGIWLTPMDASTSSLPPIDVDTLIVGLQRSESLLKSGSGRLKIYCSRYFDRKNTTADSESYGQDRDRHTDSNPDAEKGGKRRRSADVIDLEFAFCGEHLYTKHLDPFGGESPGEVLFDGRMELIIAQPGNRISVHSGSTQPPGNDPRSLGMRYNTKTLSDFLLEWHQQKQLRFVGSEVLGKTTCYVVESPDPVSQEAHLKFWISPEDGFHCVRILRHTSQDQYNWETQWQKYQLPDESTVWFPARGVLVFTRGKEHFRNEMEILDFQANPDISHFFHLEIPPDRSVWNSDLREAVLFQEIGWRGLEEGK